MAEKWLNKYSKFESLSDDVVVLDGVLLTPESRSWNLWDFF